MKKVFLLGVGPVDGGQNISAVGLRTLQFYKFLKKNHDVEMVILVDKICKDSQFLQLKKDDFFLYKKIKNIINKNKKEFDVFIGVNNYASFVLSKIKLKKPLWCDLNGWIIGELQAQAFVMNNNLLMQKGMRYQKSILTKSDRVSVVSLPQKYATYGEMSQLGLLSKENFNNLKISVIENTNDFLPKKEFFLKNKKENYFRGKIFPQNAKSFLWLGGFNAWADEKLLFLFISELINKDKNIYLVVTGGILKGIDEFSFPTFKKRVENSEIKNNVIFLGWIDSQKIPDLLLECDAGVNIDKNCIETEIGARNRINEFLRFDLLVVSTEGSEIANKIKNKNAGVVFKGCDYKKTCEEVFNCLEDVNSLKIKIKSAQKLRNLDFSTENAMKELRDFVKNPQFKEQKEKESFFIFGLFIIKYFREYGLKKLLFKIYERLFK